jgi:RNA 2',3'-cyclic 3'-phosphodiesterase
LNGNWFVGLPIAAGPWFHDLTADAPPDVRVFHPDDLHLTVAFLGRCGETRARAAWDVAAGFHAAPVHARLGGLRAMGNKRRPSALSVVLTGGQEEIVAILRALRDPMIAAAGARPETREPLPHLTVARPAMRATPDRRNRAVAWAESKAPLNVEVVVDHLTLYTWSDDRKARQFKAVEKRLLR